MKQGSTLFLKFVITLIGAFVLSLCLIVLPVGIMTDQVGGYRNILFGLYIPAVPFFFALIETYKLLTLIDNNHAFSTGSVSNLKNIKFSAILISLLFSMGMPYVYYVAEKDDAPGIILIGLVIIFTSIVIATFAGVLQKLIQNAVDIKSENDLTV